MSCKVGPLRGHFDRFDLIAAELKQDSHLSIGKPLGPIAPFGIVVVVCNWWNPSTFKTELRWVPRSITKLGPDWML